MSFVAVGLGAASLIAGGIKSLSARKQQKKAERKERKARKEMNRQMEAFRNLDTSNPYANMENTMEDLTINQKQADMQNQQFQQSQANILDATRGASGGSGVAAIAQQLAQSGQLASQQAAAQIGQQEQATQMAERQAASSIQQMERQEAANQKAAAAQAGQIQNQKIGGDIWSRGQEEKKVSTMLGMAQQQTAQYNQQAAQARQAKMDGIMDGISGATTAVLGSMDAGTFNLSPNKKTTNTEDDVDDIPLYENEQNLNEIENLGLD